jgi:hypothetical protein
MLGIILIEILVLALLGAHLVVRIAETASYYPTSGLGLILLIVVVPLLLGRI